MNNETLNIIANNAHIHDLWVKCANARNNYNSYQPREYDADAIAMITHLESEYHKTRRAYQKALEMEKKKSIV